MSQTNRPRSFFALAGWIALSLAAGVVGGIASAGAGEFYEQLTRPPWAPPSWLFSPVWIALYLLMGTAAWLTWRERGLRGAALPLTLFVVQLVFNALWSWIFFVWQTGALAFAEIVLLWALIAVTMYLFWRIRTLAGVLLVPYLLWVSFAAVLTYDIWQANPALLGQ